MPLYEYECTKCKKRFEKIQSFSDSPITKCIHCGSRVKKLISPPAIQFKGSGWYVTDYARKRTSADKEKKEESKVASSEKKESPKKESSSQSKN